MLLVYIMNVSIQKESVFYWKIHLGKYNRCYKRIKNRY